MEDKTLELMVRFVCVRFSRDKNPYVFINGVN